MTKKIMKITQSAETRRKLHTHTHTHTSKALLSFLSIILISAPAFSYVTNSSHCDNDVLSTYSGSANLTANWQGNPITVTWYNGDTEYDSNQCTYGGNLTMPSSIPQKTGYTFKGWRVRDLTCGLIHQSTLVDGEWSAFKTISGQSCIYMDFSTGDYSESCSDTHIVGLNNGEWKVAFPYGILEGTSYCSAKNGDNNNETWNNDSTNWLATESELTSASGEKKYCWCKVAGYTSDSGNQCSLASSAWIFSIYGGETGTTCMEHCTSYCMELVGGLSDYRSVLYSHLQ